MKKLSTVAAIAGIAIAVAGCSSSVTHRPAAPSPRHSATPAAAHYTSAQAIADKLATAGITVTGLKKDTSGGYVSQTGGQSYDAQISEKPGQTIGSSGIDLFPNPKAVAVWTGISQGFGGIAVIGDTWAISLPSSSSDRAITNRLAPRIATALGGKIKR